MMLGAFAERLLDQNIIALIIPLVAVVGGVVIAIVAIFSGNAAKVRQAELEAALKQDMLNRGMSAEQIRQIIEASAPPQRRR